MSRRSLLPKMRRSVGAFEVLEDGPDPPLEGPLRRSEEPFGAAGPETEQGKSMAAPGVSWRIGYRHCRQQPTTTSATDRGRLSLRCRR